VDSAIAYVREHRSLLGFEGADHVAGSEILEMPCELLCPCAVEDQITEENASRIRAKALVEGANGPTSSSADAILEDAGVFVVPDILANAGGVTGSYFEWVQNRTGYRWPEAQVEERLERVVGEAFEAVLGLSERRSISMRLAATVSV
jgi:glutamate dehydrogenase (NAD(P)+)